MRFPRLFAFYRSYPEFDGYPDEQCRKLVHQAILRRGDAAWVLPLLLAIGLMGAWTLFGGVLLAVLATASGNTLPPWSSFMTPILLFEVPGFIVAYVWMRRLLLVRSIRRIVNRAACPFCEFSLVGLPVKVNAVVCPECGQKVQLTAHGMRREDLDVNAPDPFKPQRPVPRPRSAAPSGRGR